MPCKAKWKAFWGSINIIDDMLTPKFSSTTKVGVQALKIVFRFKVALLPATVSELRISLTLIKINDWMINVKDGRSSNGKCYA